MVPLFITFCASQLSSSCCLVIPLTNQANLQTEDFIIDKDKSALVTYDNKTNKGNLVIGHHWL